MEDKLNGQDPFLNRMESLEILSFVQRQSDDLISTTTTSVTTEASTGHVPGLPSWVPRFHQDLDTTRIYRPTFLASGKESEMRLWPSDAGSLKISGYRLDTVEEIEPKTAEYSVYNISSWLKLASNVNVEELEGNATRLDVLWRTLITNDEFDVSNDKLRGHPFRVFLCDLLGGVGTWRKEWEADLREIASDEDAYLVPTAEDIKFRRAGFQQDVFHFMAKLKRFYSSRCLWLTHRCRRLGLGSQQTRAGDQVWLLSGGRTPFVLRPIDGSECFEFVGECYVHGWMHGEVAPDTRKEKKSKIERRKERRERKRREEETGKEEREEPWEPIELR